MTRYGIVGMSCSACSSRIEKVVGRIEGVSSCSVSLLTNSMIVEGDVESSAIIKAVNELGFKASLQADLTDRDTPVLKKRLIKSLGFLVVLMYISMGYGMFIDKQYFVLALLQMILAVIIMVINRQFFISGFKKLIKLSPNMDTLVAMGATASFMWSLFSVVLIGLATISNTLDKAEIYYHDLYFESTGMILTLITVGKMLEARSKGHTTDAIKSLMKLAPQKALVVSIADENNITEEEKEKAELVDITQIKVGDYFIVKSGESIPVDGVVVYGNASLDESTLTGESIPIEKENGDKVYAATLSVSGYLICKATFVGSDTALSKIISLVAEAAATKAPIARIADKISGIFVPSVIGISILTFVIWLLLKEEVAFAISRAVCVLVISCPCALGLATPVAVMVGSGVGARNNILFKSAVVLENFSKVTTIALDKTGTITKGCPVVTDVIAAKGFLADELMEIAYLLESRSEHPLAGAIVKRYEQDYDAGKIKYELSDFAVRSGSGVSGKLKIKDEIKNVFGGNSKFITRCVGGDNIITTDIQNDIEKLANEGKTPLIFATDSEILGIIAVADEIRDDSRRAIEELKGMDYNVVMLTGDNSLAAVNIAASIGIDKENVYSEVLPEQKAEVIERLKEKGLVAMVGDGINDSPALSVADCGVAIGAGAQIAIESADVVLMRNSLTDVVNSLILSKATLSNIKQNLFWAFIYNVICIPLAAGVYYPLFGWSLNPMIGALAMSLSSFCVVSNALRLNLVSKKFKSN